jgi:predicted nuclease with TOPRIM domain
MNFIKNFILNLDFVKSKINTLTSQNLSFGKEYKTLKEKYETAIAENETQIRDLTRISTENAVLVIRKNALEKEVEQLKQQIHDKPAVRKRTPRTISKKSGSKRTL